MFALIEQLPKRFLLASSATVSLNDAEAWSPERMQLLNHHAIARLHFEQRPSAQVADDGADEYEFEAMKLVPTEIVRVRFRDVGPLPPMDLEDEVGEFIDE